MKKVLLILSMSLIFNVACDSDDSSSDVENKMEENEENNASDDTDNTDDKTVDCTKLQPQITDLTPRLAELNKMDCEDAKALFQSYVDGGCTLGVSEVKKAIDALGDCSTRD